MRFLYPETLLLLWLLPPVAIIGARNYLLGRRSLSRLLNYIDRTRLLPGYTAKYLFSVLFFCASLAFLIFAIADPVVKSDLQALYNEESGNDLMFLIDISRSMEAEDIKPSRLRRAAESIRMLVSELPESRIGIAVFKGTALTLVPMTEDHGTVLSALDVMSPDLLSSPGTNMEIGIETALRNFSRNSKEERTLIVFSDGEELNGQMHQTAAKIKSSGVRFFIVGAGTESGTVLYGKNGDPITDSNENTVITRLRNSELERLAREAGGRYYLLDDPRIRTKISDNISRKNRSDPALDYDEERRYGFFLSVSLILMLVSLAIRRLPWLGMRKMYE